MMKGMSIGNCSGMSKLADARKKCPAPIKGGKSEQTYQTVSGAGKSKPGAPTKDPRKATAKPVPGSGFESTMIGKGKKK